MKLGEQLDIIEFSINFFERIEEGLALGQQNIEKQSINSMSSTSLIMNDSKKISNFFHVIIFDCLKILNDT